MSDVQQRSPHFIDAQKQFKLIDDLLGGTSKMRNAGRAYLHQMKMEDNQDYQNRLERSTLYPALKETLSQMVGRVFFKSINTTDVNDALSTLLDDADLEGNNIDVFFSRCFRYAMAYGSAYVLVDYFQTGEARTLADEKAMGARPYFVLIKPHQVLGFRTQKVRGKQQFSQFRYMDYSTVDDGEFGTKQVKNIYVYDIGRMRKYNDANESGKMQLVEDVQLVAQNRPLDYVPIVPFITEESEEWGIGRPPLLELAHLNVKHWRSQSDQDNILNTARVPILAIYSGVELTKLTVGSSAIQLPPDSSMQYIEHSGASIAAGQESLLKLEEQMLTAGAKLLTQTRLAMTDSQAREEQGKEISQLRYYANKLEDSIDLALSYAGNWIGIQDVGMVEISGNIDSNFDPNASMEAVLKLQLSGNLSKQSTFEEAKRRGLVSESLQWEDEQARIEAEGLAMVINNDFEQTPETQT